MLEAYKEAIRNCVKSIENVETDLDMFDMSTFLSIAFNQPKEKTLNDLVFEKRFLISH